MAAGFCAGIEILGIEVASHSSDSDGDSEDEVYV